MDAALPTDTLALDAALQSAETPTLDFLARWLMLRADSLRAEHEGTAGILRALRDRVDAERDRRRTA